MFAYALLDVISALISCSLLRASWAVVEQQNVPSDPTNKKEGLPLVTRNTPHFRRLPELELVEH